MGQGQVKVASHHQEQKEVRKDPLLVRELMTP